MPLRGLISVSLLCVFVVEGWGAGMGIGRGGWNFRYPEKNSRFNEREPSTSATNILTRVLPARQKVSIHRPDLHPWPYPDWHRRVDQDAPHSHHPSRIPALHPQIQPLREAPQEPCCPRIPRLPCRGRRPGHRRPVQASVQDGLLPRGPGVSVVSVC